MLLCGIIVNPNIQQQGIGLELLKHFLYTEKPEYLGAYTRNPGVVRLMSKAACADALSPQFHNLSIQMPNSTPIDGKSYHIGRYGPNGLYGGKDPALGCYNGTPLVRSCPMLHDPNNALAILVPVNGE